MAKPKPEEAAGVSLPSRIIIAGSILIVLLHAWGALFPGHDNWGFHFFAFYGSTALFGAILLMLLFVLPSARAALLKNLENLVAAASRVPIFVQVAVLALVVVLAGSFFAPKLHLLGDGAILLRSLA